MEGGRTADVPPPSLNSPHVKMKNNLKMKLTTEALQFSLGGTGLRPFVWWPAVDHRPATSVPPETAATHGLKPNHLRASDSHSHQAPPPTGSNQKSLKNAHFPSGTDPNQAIIFIRKDELYESPNAMLLPNSTPQRAAGLRSSASPG